MDIQKYIEANNIVGSSNKNNNFIIVSIFTCIIFLICCSFLIYIFTTFNQSSTNENTPTTPDTSNIITIVRPLDSVYPLANTIIITPKDPKNDNFPQDSVPIKNIILKDKYGKMINQLRTYNVKKGDKYYDYGLLITAKLPFYMVIIDPIMVDGIIVNALNDGDGLNLYTLNLNFSNIGNIRSLEMVNAPGAVYGFTY